VKKLSQKTESKTLFSKAFLPNRPLLIVLLFSFLALFFQTVEVSAAARRTGKVNPEPVLKVLLTGISNSIKIEFPDGGVMESDKGRKLKTFKNKEVFNWSIPDKRGHKSKIQYSGQTLVFSGKKSVLNINGKGYRGFLQIKFSADGAKVVNHVGLDDYLRGVVGSEMGSRSPLESLKAQTVIARTYAFASKSKHGSDGADVCNSTHCQVYSGISAERESIDAAVAGTRGMVMISDGDAVATLYHGTCGGMTSDNDKVFGGAPRSYLRRVECPFCKNGINYRWSRSISLADLKSALAKEKIRFDRLIEVDIESARQMDRVDNLVLYTDTGTHKIRGTTIRRLFNLPSTTFVCGSRNASGRLIAAAKPVKAETQPAVSNLKGIVTAALSDDSEVGPPQLFVQTAAGLKRAVKPSGGWHTIAWKTLSTSEKIADSAIQAGKIKESANPQINNRSLDKLEIFGRGYGHQVGMCQAGAIELGKRAWSYRQILAFYYSNVALRSLDY